MERGPYSLLRTLLVPVRCGTVLLDVPVVVFALHRLVIREETSSLEPESVRILGLQVGEEAFLQVLAATDVFDFPE